MYGGEVDGDWTGDGAEPRFPMHQCSPGKDRGRREREDKDDDVGNRNDMRVGGGGR